jgi:hypothetical protein
MRDDLLQGSIAVAGDDGLSSARRSPTGSLTALNQGDSTDE